MPNAKPLLELKAPQYRGAIPGQILTLYGIGSHRRVRVLYADGDTVHCRNLNLAERLAYQAGRLWHHLIIAFERKLP